LKDEQKKEWSFYKRGNSIQVPTIPTKEGIEGGGSEVCERYGVKGGPWSKENTILRLWERRGAMSHTATKRKNYLLLFRKKEGKKNQKHVIGASITSKRSKSLRTKILSSPGSIGGPGRREKGPLSSERGKYKLNQKRPPTQY